MQLLYLFYNQKDLWVSSATRHSKPISEVAENMTVITAREIRNMNAHNVAEILNRVTGFFVNFNQDFGASSLLNIQGSERRHVLVLLDGTSWNLLGEGAAETNSIPVEIIERIEIIKGPGSSAWGSALGGVVNIITKAAGTAQQPSGSIRASYGEHETQDYNAQVAGKAGSAGYYLFAGRQASDGLRSARDFDTTSLYSKFNLPVSSDVRLGLSLGYSEPCIDFGDYPSRGITSSGDTRTFFGTTTLDARLNPDMAMTVSLYTFKQRVEQNTGVLEPGALGNPGELFMEVIDDEKSTGGNATLVWNHGRHTLVAGMEAESGKMNQTIRAGSFYQTLGVAALTRANPDIERWALYLNDTINFGRWAVTPGIRYDENDISGSFLSPSLGVTRSVGDKSILRGSVSRGFTLPPLASSSGGGLFLDPNPSLDPEEVWSWQAGFESTAVNYLWLKTTLFYHELEKTLTLERGAAGAPTYNNLIVNKGTVRRRGIELETETVSFYNFSLAAGGAYVDIDPSNEDGAGEIYECNIGLRYDDHKSLRAELFGHYLWWDTHEVHDGEFDDFIWDLNLSKTIYTTQKTSTEIFLSAHNIFNGSLYIIEDNQNPSRWIEAGLRFNF